MDSEQLEKRKEALRVEYWAKIHHYQTASDEGMKGGNGDTDAYRSECLAEAYKAGAEIGLVPEEVAALLGDHSATE